MPLSQSLITSPWFLGSVAVLLLAWVVKKQFFWDPKLPYPTVGDPNAKSFAPAIQEGVEKYPDSPFVVAGSFPPLLVLPHSIFHEVQTMPTNLVSVAQALGEGFQKKYTGVGDGEDKPETTEVVRQELTRNLGRVFEGVQDEARYVFEKEWPQSEDWTPVPVTISALRLVSHMTARTFVGLPISRDEEWISSSINFTVDIMRVRSQTLELNRFMRPIKGPWIPAIRDVLRHKRIASDYVRPLVHEMLANDDPEKSAAAATNQRGAFMAWLLRHLPDERKTAEEVGNAQMLLTFAGIHTTSSTTERVFWALAKHPEYIAPLREEIQQVIREDGLIPNEHDQVIFDKANIAKMKKMDSFIKEVLRFYPMGIATPQRRVMQDLTLSNGIKLPKGATITWPSYAIHMSEKTPAFSAEYNAGTGNPPPDVFAGFRFYNLRELPGRESRHQNVTTSFDSLTFSHGKHACPGRFFATYEIKAVLIYLLTHYDVRAMGDVEQKGGEDKGPSLKFSDVTANYADRRAMLEVRKRLQKA